ncbi:phosphoribosyltransferase, partial [Candidatus Margulisiibacteriota bacterium]
MNKSRLLLSERRLKNRVRILAQKISKDFSDKRLVVVCILKGAMVFCSDLIREINLPLEIDFIQVSSYGAKKKSAGIVRIT